MFIRLLSLPLLLLVGQNVDAARGESRRAKNLREYDEDDAGRRVLAPAKKVAKSANSEDDVCPVSATVPWVQVSQGCFHGISHLVLVTVIETAGWQEIESV